jgi:hypothetical protein
MYPLVVLLALAAPVPSPGAREAVTLVEKLGSADFVEREAATKRLDELGAAALEELRAASKSENPETARRAQELVRKIERRVSNDKTLAPTLVELNAENVALDAVLADLSKQVGYDVVLGGLKPDELAVKKIAVKTDGKVPFWTAVLKVCDAADLQVAVVTGFVAPGSMPYLGRAKAGVRVAANPSRAVVLEARGTAAKRPASVHGSVLIEVVSARGTELLLQAWPEPKLQWQTTSAVKVTTALGDAGQRVMTDASVAGPPSPFKVANDGVAFIRNADGTVTMVNVNSLQGASPGPNARQALVKFKAAEGVPRAVKQLSGSLFATVRSGVEPLVQAGGLEPGKTETGTGISGIDLSASYGKDRDGKLTADVVIAYDPKLVQPAGVGDDLPGAKAGAGVGFGNQTVHGIRAYERGESVRPHRQARADEVEDGAGRAKGRPRPARLGDVVGHVREAGRGAVDVARRAAVEVTRSPHRRTHHARLAHINPTPRRRRRARGQRPLLARQARHAPTGGSRVPVGHVRHQRARLRDPRRRRGDVPAPPRPGTADVVPAARHRLLRRLHDVLDVQLRDG